jgi:hypothetical protein
MTSDVKQLTGRRQGRCARLQIDSRRTDKRQEIECTGLVAGESTVGNPGDWRS